MKVYVLVVVQIHIRLTSALAGGVCILRIYIYVVTFVGVTTKTGFGLIIESLLVQSITCELYKLQQLRINLHLNPFSMMPRIHSILIYDWLHCDRDL
jgi:hypothetical protein